MNRPIQIIAFFSIISFNSFSQDTIRSKVMQSIYAEGGGIGAYYSLNYEIRFPVGGLRIGGEMMNYNGQTYTQSPVTKIFMIPIELILLPNYKFKSCPEFGIAWIPVVGKRNWVEYYGPSGASAQLSSNYAIYYGLQIGYEYQTLDKHVLFRIDLTYLAISDQSIFTSNINDGTADFQIWGGISFGYAFK